MLKQEETTGTCANWRWFATFAAILTAAISFIGCTESPTATSESSGSTSGYRIVSEIEAAARDEIASENLAIIRVCNVSNYDYFKFYLNGEYVADWPPLSIPEEEEPEFAVCAGTQLLEVECYEFRYSKQPDSIQGFAIDACAGFIYEVFIVDIE